MYTLGEATDIIRRMLGAVQADIFPEVRCITVTGPTRYVTIKIIDKNFELAYRRTLAAIDEIRVDYGACVLHGIEYVWYCNRITPPTWGGTGSKTIEINLDTMATSLWKKTIDNSELLDIKADPKYDGRYD
ncbi:MAG: hypothetical protein K2F99_08460 [Muribaculaceae bacterium]|nr:hypothetical protein [Muribaculaceae bacterium]